MSGFVQLGPPRSPMRKLIWVVAVQSRLPRQFLGWRGKVEVNGWLGNEIHRILLILRWNPDGLQTLLVLKNWGGGDRGGGALNRM